MVLRRFKIRGDERGFRFVDGEFVEILCPGVHWYLDPLHEIRVDVLSVREPWIAHPDLDLIVDAGVLIGEATVVELEADERALVWIDGRFVAVIGPGIHALWKVRHRVLVEVIDAGQACAAGWTVASRIDPGLPGLAPNLRRSQA